MAKENVVLARFTEPSKAYQALSVLKECDANGRIGLRSAAVVERTPTGELRITEGVDNVGLVGTASGSLIGMLVGVRVDVLVEGPGGEYGEDYGAFEALMVGADGWVAGVSNTIPQHAAKLSEPCRSGDVEAARASWFKLLPAAPDAGQRQRACSAGEQRSAHPVEPGAVRLRLTRRQPPRCCNVSGTGTHPSRRWLRLGLRPRSTRWVMRFSCRGSMFRRGRQRAHPAAAVGR